MEDQNQVISQLSENKDIRGLGTIIRSKSPLRVSFVGGGTDLPHWYKNRGSIDYDQ